MTLPLKHFPRRSIGSAALAPLATARIHVPFQSNKNSNMQFIKIVNGEPTPFHWLQLEGKATPAQARMLKLREAQEPARVVKRQKQRRPPRFGWAQSVSQFETRASGQ